MKEKSGSNLVNEVEDQSSYSRPRQSPAEGAALIRAFYRIERKEVRDAIVTLVTRLSETSGIPSFRERPDFGLFGLHKGRTEGPKVRH